MRLLEAWFAYLLLTPSTAFAEEAIGGVGPPEVETASEAQLLATALRSTFPTFLKEDATALRHSTAALAAEAATDVPAELLLAIPAIESNFDPVTISRKECHLKVVPAFIGVRFETACDRVHGRWRGSRTKPENVQGTYYCGLHQTGGNISWASCWRIIHDEEGSYLAAAQHLQTWFDDSLYCRKIKGEAARWDCALWGYGGGYPLIRLGLRARRPINRDSPLGYPLRVRGLETLLHVKRDRLKLRES